MLRTFQTQIRQGQILLSDEVNIPEDAIIFVSYKDNSIDDFFLKASESTLNNIWNNN
jgi:hypothetical protein